MNPLQVLISFFGRLAYSLIFLIAGVKKIMNWKMTEQNFDQELELLRQFYHQGWAQGLLDQLMPVAPTLLMVGTIMELAGGVLILLGLWTRFGALLICIFLVPATFLFHDFWTFSGLEQQMQLTMFLKNLSIFGGALLLLAFGSGPKKATSGK